MRNKKRFAIFLVFLTILAVVLLGCVPAAEEGGGGSGGGAQVPADLEKILAGMQTVLGNTQKQANAPDTLIYSVDSTYSLDLAEFKYTITLDANFNEKNPADSTIYFKVFDDEDNRNRVMTYFTEGTLYLDILGETSSYANFGSSSAFKMYYNAVRAMDLSRTLFSDEIIEVIGDILFIKPYIGENNVSERSVGETGKYYEFTDINLDTQRNEPNKLLQSFFAPLGDKLDALTDPLLGIPFSRLAGVQVATWTVDKLSVSSETELLKQFDFGFSGMLDSREDYNVTGSCVVDWKNREIKPSAEDNPFFDDSGAAFPDGELGNYAFTGTLTLKGMAESNYDVDILLKTDENDNRGNKLSFLLNQGGSSARAASVFYDDGVLYADLGEIMTLLGNGLGLSEMGFPKVKTSKFNMSQSFGSLLAELERLLSDVMGDGSFQVDAEARDLVLKKLSSDKDGYCNLFVDKELVTYFAGGEQNVVEYIAQSLGIEQETAQRYFRSETFDKIYALIRLNVETKNLVILLNDGEEDVLTLSLYPSEFDEGELDRNIADAKNGFGDYGDFITPEDIGVRMEGAVTVSSGSDFSKFFGAFIGDSYGKNTPVVLDSGAIGFRVEALDKFDGSYRLHAKTWLGAESDASTYFELWALPENGNPMLYVDYKKLGFRYQIPAKEVRRALSLALGEDNILVTGDLIEIFSRVLSVSQISMRDDGMFVKILPANEKDDPLYDIFKIRGLTAVATTAVRYSFEDGVFDFGNPNDYVVPTLETLPQQDFESLYDAQWIEKVRIKDFDVEMFIPYDPETITLVDGKTVYVPSGKLFGQELRYYMTISGGVNGTKEVVGIKNDCLTIDPWAEKPLKDTIEVQFKDGTEGRLPYVIEGFSESLINPQGMDRTKFRVRFGTEKSILYRVLDLDVEVEIRTLDNGYTTENGLTIVGTKNVNPLKFFEEPFEFLPTKITLDFRDMRPGATQGALSTETFLVDWEYDYAKEVNVTGGTTTAKLVGFLKEGSNEVYDLKPLGYRVDVEPKQYDYIQISTEKGKNVYTVDVLSKATYAIPSISTSEQEIRIYYTDGTYSTVGGDSSAFLPDFNRNGFFTEPVDWLYKEAKNIAANGSVKPLGSTNVDTATYSLRTNFNGVDLNIAEFSLKLEVSEPAASLVKQGTTTGVIANSADGNSLTRTRGNFDYHAVDFGAGYNVPFRFDPYAATPLPSVVKVKINTATKQGEYSEVEKIYPVRWQTDGNVVSEDGMLLYPSAENMNFRAIGLIGDGNVTLELSAVIDNIQCVYQSVTYYREDANGNRVKMDGDGLRINAYEPYLLPNVLALTLENGKEIEIRDVRWNWIDGTDVKLWSQERYDAYAEFLKTGKGDFDILKYWSNPQPDDGVGYRFDNRSETYNIEVSVRTENSNIYENTIGYSVGVSYANDGKVFTGLGVSDGNRETVDPYHQDSASLVALLTSDTRLLAPVRFTEGADAKYYPVVWDAESLDALLKRLKAGDDNSDITLKGTIFKGITGLEQSVTGVFSVLNKTVAADGDSVKFPNLASVQASDAAYSVDTENNEKILHLQLKRPYALFTKGGALLTPSAYLKQILANVNLVFLGGASGTYLTRFDFLSVDEAEFDKAVLNFGAGVASTDVTFVCYFTSQGSTEDHVVVKLNTVADTITETGVSQKLDRFEADGSVKYPDGYVFGDTVTVTFTASGRLSLPVRSYTVSSAPSDASISAGNPIKSLPSKEFEGFSTRIYNVISALDVGAAMVGGTLRDTVEIMFNFEINAADVRFTAFGGESAYLHNGAEYRLKIVNGVIVFDSVFDYYGFLKDGAYDVSKLPSVVTPNVGSSYGQNNTFTVNWKAVSVPSDFNAYYTEEGALAATAAVGGYGASVQTLNLYVRILKKDAVSVSKEGYNFASDGEGGFVLTIDPYAATDGYAMWETTLPSTVDVGLSQNGSVSYAVSQATYKTADNLDFDTRLLYDYRAFESNKKDTLELNVSLEDGTQFALKVKLVNRTVQSVSFPYRTESGTAFSENKLWIDPYDTSFAGIPKTATVNFANGASETLPILLTPVADELEVKYSGGKYSYRFALYGYRNDENGNPIPVDSPQTVDIEIIVVPRVLTGDAKRGLETSLKIDDGIAYRLSDLTVGTGLKETDFEPSAQNTEIPSDFRLTIPTVSKWYAGGAEVTDSRLVPGSVLQMEGLLSDSAAGETIRFELTLKTMRYDAIGTVENGVFTECDKIRFDVFNAESIEKRYVLRFFVSDPNDTANEEEKWIEFDTSDGAGSYRIWWSDEVKNSIGTSAGQGGSPVVAKFYFGNPQKEIRFDGEEKTFYLMQIDDISANFGYNNDTDGTSGKAVYVYDPLNPVFPTTVTLTGVVGGERIQLGEQNVDWNGFTPDGGFYYASRQHSVTLKSKTTQFSISHYVEVLTLDRSEFRMVSAADITTEALLDPAEASSYDQVKNEYVLPRELTMTFLGTANQRAELKTALADYGQTFRLSNARWWLGKVDEGGIRKISLDGNEGNPWPMVLTSAEFRRSDGDGRFTIAPNTILSQTEDRKVNPFHTSLTVKNRSVIETGVTGVKQNGVFRAEKVYSLDPYDVAGTLPKEITVSLGGETRTFKDPAWTQTGEILNEMIEGSAADEKNYVAVELRIFADKIVINFPVKARPLADQGKIDGGTYYVNYGTGDRKEIFNQLPKRIYFNFGWKTGENDYTAVPLRFSESSIPLGSKLAPGVPFDLEGVIGVSLSGNPNFVCTVVPVSPRLYALWNVKESGGELVDYVRLDYWYDEIPVPVNSSGNVLGSSAIKSALPSYLWLGEGLQPVKILAKDFVYDANRQATQMRFTAAYSFRTTDSVNEYLAVDANGGRSFAIDFTLPLKKYDTSSLLAEPSLDASGIGEDGYYHFALGAKMSQSSLPNAIYRNDRYGIYWDFSNVRVNAAGGYAVEGKLIVSEERVYTFTTGFYIDPTVLDARDVFIEASELKFTYTGIAKQFNVMLSDIIKEDGTLGKPNYYLSYARKGDTNFIRQPYLDAGTYVVRVQIDDRNATGSRDFEYEITKWRVTDISWGSERTFEYREGQTQSPKIVNLPSWVQHTLIYQEIDADGVTRPLTGAPVDAGRYSVGLSIPKQDNCEESGEALAPVEFIITKKNPNYKVVSSLTYDGTYRHVTVSGLPEVLENGMSVSYEYYLEQNGSYYSIGSDKIRNAGNYMAIVTVNGGKNYVSQAGISGNFTIGKATLTVTLSDVESYYLQSLLPFTAGVRYSAPFGTDTLANFTELQLISAVTERSVPGRYPFSVGEGSLVYSDRGTVYDNYNVEYVGLGTAAYVIKMNEGVRLVRNREELNAALGALKTNDSVSFYLEAGNYGKIELNAAADVTLTGCYSDSNTASDAALAVSFDGIAVKKGTLRLDLVTMKPTQSAASLEIGFDAGDVTVRNSKLVGDAAAGIPTESTAIYAERGYAGVVTLDNATVAGYTVGVSMESGGLSLSDTEIASCRYGATVQNGAVRVERTLFRYNASVALIVNGAGAFGVTGSRFDYNGTAVRYTRELNASELEELLETGENVYAANGNDVVLG